MPANAFREDRFMTSIELPAGLTSIQEHAFNSCSSLLDREVTSSDLGAASPPQVHQAHTRFTPGSHQARTALHLATAKFGFADE